MWAVALVYLGAILLVVCSFGWFAERTLLRNEDLESQVAEDTCRKHGILMCSRCFDLSGCRHPLTKRWWDSEKCEEFCECGVVLDRGPFDYERSW